MKAPNIHFDVKLGQSANPGDFFVDPLRRSHCIVAPVCTENLIHIDCVTESSKRQRR
jgi:hypothetical protein